LPTDTSQAPSPSLARPPAIEPIKDRNPALAGKPALRRLAAARRAEAARLAGSDAAERVARRFVQAVPLGASRIVAGYWPIRDELDCRPLLFHLLEAGHAVCLPSTPSQGPPIMRMWHAGVPLKPSGFGTMAPGPDAPFAEPEIVLLPLLGFDARGTRLGYGKGHYDQLLAALDRRPLLVGLAYAAQQLTDIPREPHDVPLDMVVTESGVLRFDPGTPA
jgi:5-formyltetrahydrofolate cyclo-ligase